MRYFIFIVVVAAVGWIVFLDEQKGGDDNLARSLTDSEVIPLADEKDISQVEIRDTTSDSEEIDNENREDGVVIETMDEATANEQSADEVSSSPQTGDLGDQEFILYTNQAVGYTIERPDKWYWQHFHKSEIGDENPVDDYMVMDSNPFPGLGSEYLGMIVIEVSKRGIEDFSESVSGLQARDEIVGGVSATRYEGERLGNRTIEYHMIHRGRTLRILYTNAEMSTFHENIFQAVVSSFTFF